MNEIKNEDLGQEVFDLFDSYVHSKISRRDFMDRVSKYAVGGLTVGAILDYLSPKYASAQQVRAGDQRLDEAGDGLFRESRGLSTTVQR